MLFKILYFRNFVFKKTTLERRTVVKEEWKGIPEYLKNPNTPSPYAVIQCEKPPVGKQITPP